MAACFDDFCNGDRIRNDVTATVWIQRSGDCVAVNFLAWRLTRWVREFLSTIDGYLWGAKAVGDSTDWLFRP